MNWTELQDFFNATDQFFTDVFGIVESMMGAMNRATFYLDETDFNTSIVAEYIGYFRFIVGDLVYIAFITVAQIALGITLWKLLLKGVMLIKSLLPW
jgi:hypothetical protein